MAKKSAAETPEKDETPAKAERPAKADRPAKKDKDKKPNIFVRMGRKLKETFMELKNVSWPSFGKALKATGVVIVVVLVFTVLVTCVNVGFTELLKLMTQWGT